MPEAGLSPDSDRTVLDLAPERKRSQGVVVLGGIAPKRAAQRLGDRRGIPRHAERDGWCVGRTHGALILVQGSTALGAPSRPPGLRKVGPWRWSTEVEVPA